SSSGTASVISGGLVDGLLIGSKVDCKNSSGTILASTTSDSSGKYSFPSSVTSCSSLEVTGGIDKSTGSAFEGMLKAPAASAGTETYVTPLSTLVAAAVESGKTKDEAVADVKTKLGLTTDVLTKNPYTAQDAKLFKAVAVVAQLMKENTAVMRSALGSSTASTSDSVKQQLFALSSNALYSALGTSATASALSNVISSTTSGASTTNTETVMKSMTENSVTLLTDSSSTAAVAAVVNAVRSADANIGTTFSTTNKAGLTANLGAISQKMADKVTNIADNVPTSDASFASQDTAVAALAKNVDVAIQAQAKLTNSIVSIVAQTANQLIVQSTANTTLVGNLGTALASEIASAKTAVNNSISTCVTSSCSAVTAPTIAISDSGSTLSTAITSLGGSATVVTNEKNTLAGTNVFKLNANNAFTAKDGTTGATAQSVTGTTSGGVLTIAAIGPLSGSNLANLVAGTGTAPTLSATLQTVQSITGTKPVSVTLELMDGTTYARETGKRYIKIEYGMVLTTSGTGTSATATLAAPANTSATVTYYEAADTSPKVVTISNVTGDDSALVTSTTTQTPVTNLNVKIGNLFSKNSTLSTALQGVNVKSGSFSYTVKMDGLALKDGSGNDIQQIRGTFTTSAN
ncbi:MAG: hypothetical protein H7834_16655, partial [Magnetococcus sp. YQC-9]